MLLLMMDEAPQAAHFLLRVLLFPPFHIGVHTSRFPHSHDARITALSYSGGDGSLGRQFSITLYKIMLMG